jgi:hypothetical protein
MISESTFRDYVARGVLPRGVMIGGPRRWSRTKLNAALENLEERTLNGETEMASAIRSMGNGTKAKIQRDAA